jgi:hypothetical protein
MKGTFCRMSVWTRGMPSKKKRAKMPAEAPKAAPMGPLFVERMVRGWVSGGLRAVCLLHPEESAGSVLAELEFGDVVAVVRWG